MKTNSPFTAFELFLSEEIVIEVCKCTNSEGRRVAIIEESGRTMYPRKNL